MIAGSASSTVWLPAATKHGDSSVSINQSSSRMDDGQVLNIRSSITALNLKDALLLRREGGLFT